MRGLGYEGDYFDYFWTPPAWSPTSWTTPAFALPPSPGGIQWASSPGVESVTVSASPSWSPTVATNVTAPTFTPNAFNTPAFALPPLTTPANGGGGTPGVESVTVSADAQPQVQAVTPPMVFDFNTPAFALPPSPVYNGGASPGVESVTVTAPAEPQPRLVQANVGPPVFTPWAFEGYTPTIPPLQPKQQQPAQKPKSGGPSGGGSSSPKLTITNNPPTAAQQAAQQAAAQQQGVTAAQQAALNKLTPQQLLDLLQNPNLTPAQRAAIQKALAAQAAAGVPGAAAAAQKAAAASPFQSSAAMLPLLLVGGVAVAYAVTHRHQISAQVQTQYRAVRRRVRKVFN